MVVNDLPPKPTKWPANCYVPVRPRDGRRPYWYPVPAWTAAYAHLKHQVPQGPPDVDLMLGVETPSTPWTPPVQEPKQRVSNNQMAWAIMLAPLVAAPLFLGTVVAGIIIAVF